MGMWWYLNVAFYLLSPKTNDFKYFFMTLLAISLFFLWNVCWNIFCIVILSYYYWLCVCIFWIFSLIYVFWIFFPVSGLPFLFLNGAFKKKKLTGVLHLCYTYRFGENCHLTLLNHGTFLYFLISLSFVLQFPSREIQSDLFINILHLVLLWIDLFFEFHFQLFVLGIVAVVQLLSHVWLMIPWSAACQASLLLLSPRVCSNSCPLSRWAIWTAHPLFPPSPNALNLSQHQGLFQWVGFSQLVAKVLELQLQHQSFQWIVRTNFLYNWLVWSPCSPRDSQESSPAPQFESIHS